MRHQLLPSDENSLSSERSLMSRVQRYERGLHHSLTSIHNLEIHVQVISLYTVLIVMSTNNNNKVSVNTQSVQATTVVPHDIISHRELVYKVYRQAQPFSTLYGVSDQLY